MEQHDLTTTVLLHAKSRISELRSLKLGKVSISYKRENCHVKQQRQQAADMQINTDACDAISAWLVMRGDEPGLLFPGQRGERLSPSGIHRRLAEPSQVAKAEIHARSFCHIFTKSLIDTCAGLEQAARLLGCSNLNTARI